MRRLTLTATLAALAVFATPTAAPAADKGSLYCEPSGDNCVAILIKHGKRRLDIASFTLRGTYELCVRSPDQKLKCRRFKLKYQKATKSHNSSVAWRKNFGDRGKGRYRVQWRHKGRQVGKVLTFRR
jgi:hypothetical protein